MCPSWWFPLSGFLCKSMKYIFFATLLALCGAAEDQEVWKWWPPLPSGAVFTGRSVSSRRPHLLPNTRGGFIIHPYSPQSNNLIEGKPSAIAYGSILNGFRELRTESLVSHHGSKAALSFATRELGLACARDENGSPSISSHLTKCTLLQSNVLELACTNTNRAEHFVAEFAYRSFEGHRIAFQYPVTFGVNYYLVFDELIDGDMVWRTHNVTVGLDKEHSFNILQHTFVQVHNGDSDIVGKDTFVCTDRTSCEGFEQNDLSDTTKRSVRILTYNVWNVNPPANVYGSQRRWAKYNERMDHLVHFIKQSGAEIAGLQEVRYDNTFGPVGEHAQVKHLMDRLAGYQFIYQPAMTYLNDQNPTERIEEGPMIISKHPIIHSDYIILSGTPSDPNDVHQRICLHALIHVPGWGNIDVYTSHLSLSKKSREFSMVEIWKYMKQGKGDTQVLLGDLNAEPQSDGIQFLYGNKQMFQEKADLKDAWLEIHPEPVPRSQERIDIEERFTFPSDKPSKRIDYLLFRGKGAVKEVSVIGQSPTVATKDFDPNVGLLNGRSRVYASDHRGVVMELTN